MEEEENEGRIDSRKQNGSGEDCRVWFVRNVFECGVVGCLYMCWYRKLVPSSMVFESNLFLGDILFMNIHDILSSLLVYRIFY